jgi:IS605 OrfB family transposase
MATLTYCKGLPTDSLKVNALGCSELEMFLEAYAPIFRNAALETVTYLLSGASFDKSKWNTYLQATFKINKRHANGVISYAKGKVDGAKEHRALHLKTLTGRVKSLNAWIDKASRKLRLAQKFYAKPDWQHSRTGTKFPMSCSLTYRQTNFGSVRFQLHQKKRKLFLLQNKIEVLKHQPIHVSVPHSQVFVVGSKDESLGNQVSQWDGNRIKFRVPECLEAQFGKAVSADIGSFERNINRLPPDGAKSWHFYRKGGKWVAAVQFTPAQVKGVSKHHRYGCIGIDMNPGSIGWAYLDSDGNLKDKGQIPLEMGLPSGAQEAQIVEACLLLAKLAIEHQCPVVCEALDFSKKKEQLGERSRKYARMLSGWAYSQFYKLLGSILSNRGIELRQVNPAYSSFFALIKYMRMYGLSSDCAAALVIGRRGMYLAEKIPSAITAYFEVNSEKHVWHWLNKLNKLIQQSGRILCRHSYFTISNWSFLANLDPMA